MYRLKSIRERWSSRRPEELIEYVPEGGLMPFGYGLAFRDWQTFGSYTALVPFNFPVRWARRLFILLRYGGAMGQTRFEQEIERAYIRGRRDRPIEPPAPWMREGR